MIRQLALITCASWILLAAADGYAQCAFALSGTTPGYSNINFTPLGAAPSNVSANALGNAMGIWGSGCSGYGYAFPSFTQGPYSGAAGNMNVYIVWQQGRSTSSAGRCGFTDINIDQATGAIVAASIHMWPQQSDGTDCTYNWENIVAHEIGHVLGLADVDSYSECNGTIMGRNPSEITQEQCQLAGDNWHTDAEQQTQDPPGPITICDDPGRTDGTCSPLLINLRPGPYKLSDSTDPVHFDIDADGSPNRITWTERGSTTAFLALDRNANRTIDNGAELFGTATRMQSGARALNGFEVLKEFDTNHDDLVDVSDDRWHELLIWTDHNHDGYSQPEELQNIEKSPVRAIETGYRRTNRKDAAGNVFRYQGSAHFDKGPRTIWDVYFSPVP